MPTITNAVAKVDTSFPPHERMIFLTEDDFDGGAGEGDFVNGNGPDYINVYSLFKKQGHKIEIYVQEVTGGAADAVIITILPNKYKRIHTVDTNRDKTPLGTRFPNMDEYITITNNSNPIEIRAEAGQTVTYNYDGVPFSDLEIDMFTEGAGDLGDFQIKII